ncbi:3-oxoacyl-ACP reductase FabG [Desulfovibrio inopinatus]|uniref:3-oxoacyl-ACP reductase FabG n=1 Tax=Desulfovibrio inopinatus TaxID=102109 RepID=UPI000686B36C|nr:3-oxoacyl-ACP reductase FabG [Desulfovibrio inopinatus]
MRPDTPNTFHSERFALITGASRGIGRSIALQLAEDGYSILLNYHSRNDAAENVREQIIDLGQQCHLVPFDVSSAKETTECLSDIVKQFDPSVVVNNAGFARDGLLAMMSDEQWNDVLAVHLNGFYHVTRAVLPRMIRKRYGRIVNIVSISGQTGVAGQVNYSAAKAGIIGATRSLAVEVARRNITVNAVAPGFIDTEMLSELPSDEIQKTIPMRRIGSPEDVAHAVSFLVSEKASYITGQVLAVNGGLYT